MQKPIIELPPAFQQALIRCYCHLGGSTSKKALLPYVYAKRSDNNIHVFNINLQWEKIILAARAFCSIENPADVVVVSSKEFGRKAVLRFCEYTGATPFTGRFIPGGFTNQEVSKIREPRLIIVSDSFTDRQTVEEASYVNVPCIAFCNTDNETRFVDLVIPMNNRSPNAIGAGFCILAKVINYMKGRGGLTDNLKTEIERYFYRNTAELEELAAEQEEDMRKEEVLFEEEMEIEE